MPITIVRGKTRSKNQRVGARASVATVPKFAGFGRTEVINYIIGKKRYQRYLEIGCLNDECFRQIRCATKVGVDPVSGGTLRMTSDQYFQNHSDRFDLIFIDGDHRHPQVLKDITNAVKHLASSGMIVMHDCFPPTLKYEEPSWCGTVWRAFAKARERVDLDAVVLEMPGDGVGLGLIVVRRNSARIILGRSLEELTYADLLAHSRDWMRKMPIQQALRFIGIS